MRFKSCFREVVYSTVCRFLAHTFFSLNSSCFDLVVKLKLVVCSRNREVLLRMKMLRQRNKYFKINY